MMNSHFIVEGEDKRVEEARVNSVVTLGEDDEERWNEVRIYKDLHLKSDNICI